MTRWIEEVARMTRGLTTALSREGLKSEEAPPKAISQDRPTFSVSDDDAIANGVVPG